MIAALLLSSLAFAADPPPKKDPQAYEKSLISDANVCGAICMDELNILLFSGMITVPFERPSVEQCGIWMSGTQAERLAELTARRKEADDEALKNKYTPREREELRKRKTAPVKQCEAEFKRRCEEVKKSIPLEKRQKSVADAKAEIGRILDETRKTSLQRYLSNVLTACPLDQ